MGRPTVLMTAQRSLVTIITTWMVLVVAALQTVLAVQRMEPLVTNVLTVSQDSTRSLIALILLFLWELITVIHQVKILFLEG